MNVPRWLNPKTNPALYTAALGVLFAIWQALQVQAAAGPLTWSQVGRVAGGVILAAVVYGPHRRATTPVADPRDGNGKPLMGGLLPFVSKLDEAERRRAENLRLTHAPGSPSFYPYPGEPPAPPAQPVAGTTP